MKPKQRTEDGKGSKRERENQRSAEWDREKYHTITNLSTAFYFSSLRDKCFDTARTHAYKWRSFNGLPPVAEGILCASAATAAAVVVANVVVAMLSFVVAIIFPAASSKFNPEGNYL